MNIIKLWPNKKIKTFILFFVSFLLLSGFFISVVYINEFNAQRKAYLRSLENKYIQMSDYLNQGINTTINVCNMIFSARWYTHYRNIAGIYNDEFDLLRREEIQKDLNSKVTALEAVHDILIITPAFDTVISKKGWYSISEYVQIYNEISIDGDEASYKQIPDITSVNSNLCTLILEDINNRRDKTAICILFSKSAFASYMSQVIDDDMEYVNVILDGQPLYEYGSKSGSQIVHDSSANSHRVFLTVSFPKYEDVFLKEKVTSYILLMIIIFLSSVFLSVILTSLTYKPLKKILNLFYKNNPNTVNDPYKSITQYVKYVSDKNEQLSSENANLSEAIDNFLSKINNELMMSMLTNQDFDFNDNFFVSIVPWINDGYPYTMILLEPVSQPSALKEDIENLKRYAEHICLFHLIDNEICLLIWFKDSETAGKQYSILYHHMEILFEKHYYFVISALLFHPEEMRENYLIQKAELSELKKAQYELPISIQIDLLKNIQEAKYNACNKILNNCINVYEPDAFMSLLVRFSSEHNIDAAQTIAKYQNHSDEFKTNEQWNIINEFTYKICREIKKLKAQFTNQKPSKICKFIEQNYFDPDMSVKMLSDKYSLHRTQVSKMVKSEIGLSFSDYLLDLRMKEALNLIKLSDFSITTIAEKVGYLNYTSFRRAFIRYQGITPREYRNSF